ncbi:MAG TPA: MMPL family transporter [Flavobacteriaceae bacterium]|nr:MMPL family transporter [Flavobacteriaceae bacterium]
MSKLFSTDFWTKVARFTLRNRPFLLIALAVATGLLATQWQHIKFTHTEANLLPDDHAHNLEYNKFLELFGEEGNLIVMGVTDSTLFTPEKLAAWETLAKKINTYSTVDFTLSIGDLPILKKNDETQSFEIEKFITDSITSQEQVDRYKQELLYKLPFFEGLIYSPNKESVRTAVYLKKELVNTPFRERFILDDLIPLIEEFEESQGIQVHTSGMPYIRTLNAKNIVDEIGIFVGAALFITSLIFFFFFRSVRATLIALSTVLIAVMWVFGTLGLLKYEITILTAIIPPLIIVIGIPNCIYLINKYQQEILAHGNQIKSLQRVIAKVGNATLLTNATTAMGFATFTLTNSTLLKEFGLVASINIMAVFLISIILIPILYSYMPMPKQKHLKHHTKRWANRFVNLVAHLVRKKRFAIFSTAVGLLVFGIIGIYKIEISGSLIEDMPQKAAFFKDIRYFEKEFEGIMPLEILVNTKRKKGVMSPATLKRMDELQIYIDEQPALSKSISVVNLVKYAKQAFYNGNPDYYQLPNTQERSFILPYMNNAEQSDNLLESYVDSTGQYARITTYMKDTSTDEYNELEEDLLKEISKIFPEDRFEVSITGKAFIFQKGTTYLVNNLILSLALAVFLISLIMVWMFRSFKMILVSLIPNLLPLIVTAGLMGYFGVPIKPSTILVFSIAFGISVDDAIHYLARYRQELVASNWKIKKSVYAAIRETGISMLYTSIVLLLGFSVFTLSSFGGTVALGILVSITLFFATLSNLLFLPSLLLSLDKSVSNKKTFKKLALKLFPDKEVDEIEDTD